jgi:hypothetical protein
MLHKKVIGVVSAAALMTLFAGAPAFAGTNTNNGPTLTPGPPAAAPVLGGSDGLTAGPDGNGTGSGDTNLTVNPGYLEFDPVDVSGNGGAVGAWQMPNFTAITLGGTPELTGVRIPPFSVIDATGSAAGWHVLTTVTDLVHTQATDTVSFTAGPDYTIPASTMSMTRPWVVDQSTTTAPDISTRTNNANVVPADVASFDSTNGNTIVTADPANPAPAASTNPTNGTFLISPMPLRVLVPSDASAGTYAATVTLDLISGP